MPDTAHSRARRPDVGGVMVRDAAVASALVVLVALGLALIVAPPTFASVAMGAGVAGIMMVSGAAAVRWLLGHEVALAMPGAFMVLTTQVILLLAVGIALRSADWVNVPAMAWSALAVVLVAQAALVVGYLRSPRPLLEVAW